MSKLLLIINIFFFDVVIKWPVSVHDARIFSNSVLNKSLRNEYIPSCSKIIVEVGRSSTCMYFRRPCVPIVVMKEFVNGGSNEKEQFFGLKLSSARMVIGCVFGRLEGRFGCLRREMDINIEDLPYVIHACFCYIISVSCAKSLSINILLKLPRNMTVNSNQPIKALDIKKVIMKVQEKNLEEYL